MEMLGTPLMFQSQANMCGVAKVSAVGASVNGVSAGDVVISKGSLGKYRAVAKAQEGDVVKVNLTSENAVDFGAVLSHAVTASVLLSEVPVNGCVVQSGADTLLGQSLVQIARQKGITTVNVVQSAPGQDTMISTLKNVGGDLVVPAQYALTHRFHEVLKEMPTPDLAVHCFDTVENAESLRLVPKDGSPLSKWRAFVEDASPNDVDNVNVALTLSKLAAKNVSHGPYAAHLPGDSVGVDFLKSVPKDKLDAAVAEVCDLVNNGSLIMWLESFPVEDFAYALDKVRVWHWDGGVRCASRHAGSDRCVCVCDALFAQIAYATGTVAFPRLQEVCHEVLRSYVARTA